MSFECFFVTILYFKSQVTFLNCYLISKDLKYHFRYVSTDFWSWDIMKTSRYSKTCGGDYVNSQVLTRQKYVSICEEDI